ncbi:hypothetical protein GCM10010094_94540 [Streptomyces flaveus]|uniref:Uncharacterized protein n=1 Tax=Streptomyces flaveus TaxID=66370 RepID=A0A917RQJ2_9ACTN|nr:hypothetical protein GCM10010094_94540 [Streptomyces flaveus]
MGIDRKRSGGTPYTKGHVGVPAGRCPGWTVGGHSAGPDVSREGWKVQTVPVIFPSAHTFSHEMYEWRRRAGKDGRGARG